jgi:hypothetical protein
MNGDPQVPGSLLLPINVGRHECRQVPGRMLLSP